MRHANRERSMEFLGMMKHDDHFRQLIIKPLVRFDSSIPQLWSSRRLYHIHLTFIIIWPPQFKIDDKSLRVVVFKFATRLSLPNIANSTKALLSLNVHIKWNVLGYMLIAIDTSVWLIFICPFGSSHLMAIHTWTKLAVVCIGRDRYAHSTLLHHIMSINRSLTLHDIARNTAVTKAKRRMFKDRPVFLFTGQLSNTPGQQRRIKE